MITRCQNPKFPVTISRLIFDGGKQEARLKAAAITVDQARLDYALQSSSFIEQLLLALINRNAARQTIAVIDRNLAAYREREPQIDAAAAQGVLTNSDLIEIRSVKGQIETQRLEAALTLKTSQSLLDQYLSGAALRQLEQQLSANRALSPQKAPDFRAAALRYGAAALGAQAETVRLSTQPDVQTQARVTVPAADETGVDVFAGLSWNWTIKDGGASVATARRLELERESTELARAGQIRDASFSARNLVLARENTAKRREILHDRIALSKSRMAELETLLRAGRADVASIARELLAGAEAEIMLVALDAELAQQQVAAFSAKGAGCALVQMCRLFKVGEE